MSNASYDKKQEISKYTSSEVSVSQDSISQIAQQLDADPPKRSDFGLPIIGGNSEQKRQYQEALTEYYNAKNKESSFRLNRVVELANTITQAKFDSLSTELRARYLDLYGADVEKLQKGILEHQARLLKQLDEFTKEIQSPDNDFSPRALESLGKSIDNAYKMNDNYIKGLQGLFEAMNVGHIEM